ncbi:MAG TPA: hypothetical protein VM075_10085 [Anaerolineae bacterium]|nr:hypothetical protein [Anaerolineae bacterium]
MPTFLPLSKVSSAGSTEMKPLVEDGKAFEAQPERQCPGATRVVGSALLGTFDFLHIFEAAKVALLANPL